MEDLYWIIFEFARFQQLLPLCKNEINSKMLIPENL
jgi:hypothetical protein